MHKNQIVWEPLKVSYALEELPVLPDSFALVYGHGNVTIVLMEAMEDGKFKPIVHGYNNYVTAQEKGTRTWQ